MGLLIFVWGIYTELQNCIYRFWIQWDRYIVRGLWYLTQLSTIFQLYRRIHCMVVPCLSRFYIQKMYEHYIFTDTVLMKSTLI
jgi:hypothetical protein